MSGQAFLQFGRFLLVYCVDKLLLMSTIFKEIDCTWYWRRLSHFERFDKFLIISIETPNTAADDWRPTTPHSLMMALRTHPNHLTVHTHTQQRWLTTLCVVDFIRLRRKKRFTDSSCLFLTTLPSRQLRFSLCKNGRHTHTHRKRTKHNTLSPRY